MRCEECGADVPLLREFCPHCGAPTDAGPRESRLRRGGPERSPEELQRNRKTVLIGVAALLLALGVAGKFDWPSQIVHVDMRDHHHSHGAVTVDADQLARAYSQDADAAAKRYGGREMVVSGEFLRLVPDGYGSLDMRLKTSDADTPLGADLAQVAIDDAKRLRPGERVTLSCQRVAGSGDERWLQQCAIQPTADSDEESDEPTPPAPPPPPTPPWSGNAG